MPRKLTLNQVRKCTRLKVLRLVRLAWEANALPIPISVITRCTVQGLHRMGTEPIAYLDDLQSDKAVKLIFSLKGNCYVMPWKAWDKMGEAERRIMIHDLEIVYKKSHRNKLLIKRAEREPALADNPANSSEFIRSKDMSEFE